MEKLIEKLQLWGTRKVMLLTDSNVASLYPHYFEQLAEAFPVYTIVVPAGEASKSMDSLAEIWRQLLAHNMERSDTLILFGGGMVCDLGGFAAATYKRGMHCVYCPTTLLAMIDAAIGGKTAINLDHIKNCVGVVRQPDYIMTPDLAFLKTLPEDELKSGYGELIKYAILVDPGMFQQLCQLDSLTAEAVQPSWVTCCVAYKEKVVEQDPDDRKERHVLNFGHTFGHAWEGLRAAEGQYLPHGQAVAAGLLYESLLSKKIMGLPHNQYLDIKSLIQRHFDAPDLSEALWDRLVPYMLQDKKNREGNINFTLIREIGNPVTDIYVKEYLLKESILC